MKLDPAIAIAEPTAPSLGINRTDETIVNTPVAIMEKAR